MGQAAPPTVAACRAGPTFVNKLGTVIVCAPTASFLTIFPCKNLGFVFGTRDVKFPIFHLFFFQVVRGHNSADIAEASRGLPLGAMPMHSFSQTGCNALETLCVKNANNETNTLRALHPHLAYRVGVVAHY